jgi:hypothetical protein
MALKWREDFTQGEGENVGAGEGKTIPVTGREGP